MLESIYYARESHIRLHITLANTSVCEDDISNRYGVQPIEKTPLESAYLDPGGFAFADTEYITFDVQGVSFSVKPEHLYAVDGVSFRKLGEDWVKVYLDGACLVIPESIWAEACVVLSRLNEACPDGRDLLQERIKAIPNLCLKG